jgi:mycobactin lysine-N-oxygenase
MYSDAEKHGWHTIEASVRADFIARSDRSVFSAQQLARLAFDRRCDFVVGRVLYVDVSHDGTAALVRTATDTGITTVAHDYVVNCTGFDLIGQLLALLAEPDRTEIERRVQRRPDDWTLQAPIGRFLELEGVTPYLHLPGLAGMSQGPGFANLSCLGFLADRILEATATHRTNDERYREMMKRC